MKYLRKEIQRLKAKYDNTDKCEEREVTDDESEEENDEEQDKIEEEIKMRKQKIQQKGQRSSVSAEAFGTYNLKRAYQQKIIQKNSEQRERILNIMEKSFLFRILEDNEKETVLLAFEEKRYQNGDQVIKQGDEGDVLYLIESGYYECFKQFVI